jgi:small subunit ribosomal protein S20
LANHKSAAKRARQSKKKNAVNTRRKSAVRSTEKTLLKAIAAKDIKALPALLKSFTSDMMKAAAKGVLKSETVSRKIGRVSTRVHKALTK